MTNPLDLFRPTTTSPRAAFAKRQLALAHRSNSIRFTSPGSRLA